MKTYVFSILLLCVSMAMQADIRNGYECKVSAARLSVKNLSDIMNQSDSLSISQIALIKDKIASAMEIVNRYELTEKLLHQFEIISPDLYREIDFVKGKNGMPVDVFVKFVSPEELPQPLTALTLIRQNLADENCPVSEYGDNTVIIKVALVRNVLRLLAHEFGHVKYLIPNLALYIRYLAPYYKVVMHLTYMGHGPGDPSGQSAQKYEARFRVQYRRFVKGQQSDQPLKVDGYPLITRSKSV